jgi:ankyrin repeat protein
MATNIQSLQPIDSISTSCCSSGAAPTVKSLRAIQITGAEATQPLSTMERCYELYKVFLKYDTSSRENEKSSASTETLRFMHPDIRNQLVISSYALEERIEHVDWAYYSILLTESPYYHLRRYKSYPLSTCVQKLPDGYLERIMSEIVIDNPKYIFSKTQILECLRTSIKLKKIENVKFLLAPKTILRLDIDNYTQVENRVPIDILKMDEMYLEDLFSISTKDKNWQEYLIEKLGEKSITAENSLKNFLSLIKSGNIEILGLFKDKFLLILQGDFNKYKRDIFSAAVGSGSSEMLEYVCKNFEINPEKYINIKQSCSINNLCINRDGTHVLDLNDLRDLPIFELVSNGSLPYQTTITMIQHLFEYRVDLSRINFHEENIFHAAAKNKNPEIMAYLINHLSDPLALKAKTKKNQTALEIAAEHDNLSVVKCLIDNANWTKDELAKALHYAILNNNLKMARLLISEGANLNYVVSKRWGTALHIAAFHHRIQIMELLLAQKDVEINANNGPHQKSPETPLDIVALWGDLNLANLLISKGAIVSSRTLRHAAQSGNLELVQELVRKKASYAELYLLGHSDEITNFLVDTPIKKALFSGNLESVRHYVSSGGKITPNEFHLAIKSENRDLMQYLIEKGVWAEDLDRGNYTDECVSFLNAQRNLYKRNNRCYYLTLFSTIITSVGALLSSYYYFNYRN